MKQLIAIAACGVAGVLILAFAAQASFNMVHGRPIAHATGIWAVGLKYLLTGIVVAVVAIGYALWYWFDFKYGRVNQQWRR
jgi:hypothetical protein